MDILLAIFILLGADRQLLLLLLLLMMHLICSNDMFILIVLCLIDHHDLTVGIILHLSSTFLPLKMMVDHLELTLLSSHGLRF